MIDPITWHPFWQILAVVLLGGGGLGSWYGVHRIRNGNGKNNGTKINVPDLLERSVLSQERTSVELERSNDVHEALTGAMLDINKSMRTTNRRLGYLAKREMDRQKKENREALEDEIRAEVIAEIEEAQS